MQALPPEPSGLPRSASGKSDGLHRHLRVGRKKQTIEALRQRIRALEGRVSVCAGADGTQAADHEVLSADVGHAFSLGVPAIDRRLPERGLVHGGLHEVRSGTVHDDAAAHAFIACLIARRQALGRTMAGKAVHDLPHRSCFAGPVLWCMQARAGWDCGRLFGHGLDALGVDPSRLIITTPRTRSDALWVLEEAIQSQSLSAVVGLVPSPRATQARRLALAARASGTPCFLLSPSNAPPVCVAHSRWSICAADASVEHREAGRAEMMTDAAALHLPRWSVTLERVRHGPQGLSWRVGWCDETCSFSLVSPLANAASAAQGGAIGGHAFRHEDGGATLRRAG